MGAGGGDVFREPYLGFALLQLGNSKLQNKPLLANFCFWVFLLVPFIFSGLQNKVF